MPLFAKSNSLRLIVLTSLLAPLLLAACGASQPSQPTPSQYTIGVVSHGSNLEPILTGFKAGMVERGYTEGKNITYIYNGPAVQIEPVVQDLVKAKVDMVLALGTEATLAAKKVTSGTDLPVVFVLGVDAVKAGVVTSIADHGGNLTGITTGLDVHAKRLQLLTEMAPNSKRIFLPYNPDDAAPTATVKAIKPVAAQLGLEIVEYPTRTDADVTVALQNIPSDVDSIFLVPDSVTSTRLNDFVVAANGRKLPMSAYTPTMVQSGALFSYGYDQAAAGKQGSLLADKIIKGAKAADLPVETVEYAYVINLITAKTIGLDISDGTLREATTIIR